MSFLRLCRVPCCFATRGGWRLARVGSGLRNVAMNLIIILGCSGVKIRSAPSAKKDGFLYWKQAKKAGNLNNRSSKSR